MLPTLEKTGTCSDGPNSEGHLKKTVCDQTLVSGGLCERVFREKRRRFGPAALEICHIVKGVRFTRLHPLVVVVFCDHRQGFELMERRR